MTNTIRTDLNGVAAIRLAAAGKGSSKTGAALSSLASAVAGRVANALNLASDDGSDRRGRNFVAANDLYEIERLADELAQQLAASASERAHLSAALHKFAENSAALLGARPGAYAVQHLADAIADASTQQAGMENPASALAIIDTATRDIASERR